MHSAEDLRDPQVCALRRELGRRLLKTTNMHMECILSDLKNAVPHSKHPPHAEKLAYQSHLSALFKGHLGQGRRDRRGAIPREELLGLGLPVEQAPRKPAWRRPDLRWRALQWHRWLHDNPGASMADRDAEMGRISRVWLDMSEAEQRDALANLEAEDEPPAELPDLDAGDSSDDENQDIWDSGDRDWPVREHVLAGFIHEHPSHSSRGYAGVASKASAIRKSEASALMFSDAGDIPEAPQ